MDEPGIDLYEILPEQVDVDEEVISTFVREGEFTSLAVELLKETAIWTSILACSNPADQAGDPRKWTRDEAVMVLRRWKEEPASESSPLNSWRAARNKFERLYRRRNLHTIIQPNPPLTPAELARAIKTGNNSRSLNR